MAIAFSKLVNTGTNTATANSFSLTTSVEVLAGSLLVILTSRSIGSDILASVSDDSDNSGDVNVYTVDHNLDGTWSVASSFLTRTLDSDDVVTVQWTEAAAFDAFAMQMVAYTGSETTSWKDQDVSLSSFRSAADGFESNTTGTLSQADELVVGFCVVLDTLTLTPGATYTSRASTFQPFGATWMIEDKVVAATTAVNADGTWSGGAAEQQRTICVTYKQAAGVETLEISVSECVNTIDCVA